MSFTKTKIVRTILVIISFYIIHSAFNNAHATVRYVSHNGSNTPPYTSWATAADSIMSAINISVFGDTIYVANGVYEEQVIMIPGLKLIGAGMDSCIVDTRSLPQPLGFASVRVKDSSVFKGFQVIVANSKTRTAIRPDTASAIIESNLIKNSLWGILAFNSNSIVKNNIFQNLEDGISLNNSNLFIYNNHFSNVERGVIIDAFTGDYYPVIDNNIISANSFGILVQFNSKPIIRNNTIILNGDFAKAYTGGGADTAWLYNNLVIAENAWVGFSNSIRPTIEVNNFLIGNFDDHGTEGVIEGYDYNTIINNIVMNSDRGFRKVPGHNPIIVFNNSWNNDINYSGFTPDSTNLSVDPMIVNEDSTKGELDFHLQMFSPLIDTGDPNILDVDGSRSDIGLYGGPFGERYTYQDLAPKPPRNLSAVVDSEYISLSWNPSTEADFKNYSLFRDTTAGFIADSTKFVADLIDTFYVQLIPPGIDAFYYKLTATDNQDNESGPSEELAVLLTSVNEYPSTVSNYQLYQNYPNPFNPNTKIGYKLKERGYVKLYVYDIKGELVDVLVNQVKDAGYYEVEFLGEVGSGQSAVGNRLASGIYIYQIMIKSENNIPVFTESKKMLMVK